MAWLTLRNDHLLLDLCPDLKNASFETLGAKVAELGLTLDFDIAAELAQIEAKKRRRSACNAARQALRQKIYYALGAGLKAQQRAEREAAGSASQVLALSNRGRAHSGHRELRRWAPCALTACASVRGRDTTGQPWRRCSMSVTARPKGCLRVPSRRWASLGPA